MRHTHPVWLFAALGLAGCTALPDQQLADEALKRGDNATAESHYRRLADLGYPDASIGLADLQVSSQDPEQMRLAEQTYRQAVGVSTHAQSKLGKLLAAKPNASVEERREAAQLLEQAFTNGEQSALMPLAMLYLNYPQDFPQVDVQQRISQWRQEGYPQAELAQLQVYRIQGTYDQHLDEVERICKGALDVADACYVELATVYQKRDQAEQQKALVEQLMGGYRGGRIPAGRVDDVARVLADSELGKPDEGTAQELLEEIAPTYPAAWVSLARLLYEYPGLGDVDKMMEYLDHGRAAAQPRAELLLGKLYYEGKWVPQEPRKAEKHLLKAAASGETGAHYFLGQIYARGYLGEVYPDKAVEHLLQSARSGHSGADFALAQLFSQGRGFKVNRVNAYVFSQLALRQSSPQRDTLAQEVTQQLQPTERTQAEQLLREEQQLRGNAWQASTTLQAMQ